MTRTISFIIATVGATLLFAVPAYGDNWGADKAQPFTSSTPDVIERAAAVAIEKQKVEMLNARERALGSQQVVDARSDGLNRLYGLGEYANPIDLRERALVERPGRETTQPAGFDARSEGLNRLYGLGEYAPPVVADDRFRIDQSNVPDNTVSATSSGRDIELPQLGIGLGLVLALVIGAFLMIRHTRGRPFAH